MSLRKNAPRIIGVIVPDIVTHFFASILNGIEKADKKRLLRDADIQEAEIVEPEETGE